MKRALVDLSSVIWTCLLAGKDLEFGVSVEHEGKPVLINSAQYGFENAIHHLHGMMGDLQLAPYQLIFVKEGLNAKALRTHLHPGYKVGRERHAQQVDQFNDCQNRVIEAFLDLGAQLCWQDGGVEADDVLGYLAQHLVGERWIVSGDKDLAQCVGMQSQDDQGSIHHWRAGVVDANPFLDFPHALIPVYIALVGDSADKIPGAKGFGAKAFIKLLSVFGVEGLHLLRELIQNRQLHRLGEDVAEVRELQKVIDSAQQVELSYELGRLHIERVNTLHRPLQWRAGMCKRATSLTHENLSRFAARTRLVHAGNYAQAVAWAQERIARAPYVSLDIETSTPARSDEWLSQADKDPAQVVDTFGSQLTGLSMTFGPNLNETVYLTLDHVQEGEVRNLTLDQVREFVELVPLSKPCVVHGAQFELPILYKAWGQHWQHDETFHGYLPSVLDSVVMSSYVDENRSKGLKNLSAHVLGYTQRRYEDVSTFVVAQLEWDGLGHVLARWVDDVDPRETPTPMLRVQRKMNQIPAQHVLAYGCDDAICTAALANHFRIIMEIENTWDVFLQVESFAAYLTAKAFVDGVHFSLPVLSQMQQADDQAYEQASHALNAYLIQIGYPGALCPCMVEAGHEACVAPAPALLLDAPGIKEAYRVIAGQALQTQVRTVAKLADLIEQAATTEALTDEEQGITHDHLHDRLHALADAVRVGDLGRINALMKRSFTAAPQLDLASPKQMRHLLYERMRLPIRHINDLTELERQHKPDLAQAVKRFKTATAAHLTDPPIPLGEREKTLLLSKAKVDDSAIAYALAFDPDGMDEAARKALGDIGLMKSIQTRRSLFYGTYWHAPHWIDRRIHARANPCGTVTRRYSFAEPNLQQLPKKGDGLRLRAAMVPHLKEAIICSIDFAGQELRLAAHRSQDARMLACYVGDEVLDLHSLTAAAGLRRKWGEAAVNELHARYGADLDGMDPAQRDYALFLRLLSLPADLPNSQPWRAKAQAHRKGSKNVNFTAQFGGGAALIAERETLSVVDAQLFLDARSEMFPGVQAAALRAEQACQRTGYATTLMGARRHLRDGVLSRDRWQASRAARQAWNMEIQGSAGEMSKLAMARLWQSGALFDYRARFICPIHDELVTSVHKDDALAFIRIKHQCMTVPYADMTVPIVGSISMGRNFADQIECGDTFDEARIQAALDRLFQQEVCA